MRRIITACCVSLMVVSAGIVAAQEAVAAPSADPGKPKVTVSIIKHVPLTPARKKRRQAHLSRVATSNPELRAAMPTAAAADPCGRFYSCDSNTLVFKEFRKATDPVPFGTFFVDVDTIQTSSARNQRVALNEEITLTSFTGAPEPGTMALTSVGVDELGPTGSQEMGTANFALTEANVNIPSYVMYGWYPKIRTLGSLYSYPELSAVAVIPGVPMDPENPVFQPLNLIRCDQSTNGSTIGCVDPSSRPKLTGMLSLPNILANIRDQVSKGAPTILHREANDTQASRNRQIICPDSRPRPAGKSCDEYPFAKSKEGGGAGGFGGWAFVPSGEQDSQGGYIGSFTQNQRLMDNDAYEVVIN